MDKSHLYACPNEILQRIIDELDSADTASFALSSKAMLEVSLRAIEKHRAEKYSTISFGPPDVHEYGTFEVHHPLFFLAKTFSKPSIATYVTEIHIIECTSDPDDQYYCFDDFPDEKAIQLEQILVNQSHEISVQYSWLSEARRGEWRSALSSISNQQHFIGILLTMLPNLESITMTSMSFDCDPIMEIIDIIASANNNPGSPLHGKALTKLLEISLRQPDTEYAEPFGLYAPFTALPSMRSIHGSAIAANDQDHPRAQPQRNDIEEIKIVNGAVCVEAWAWMLKSIRNLKRFGYAHYGFTVGDAEYDGRGIVDLLRRYASHSLRRLDLCADNSEWEIDPFLGHLKDFQVLRILRLDDNSFQTTAGRVMRLIDMLPASIRVVRLLREASGDAVDLFKGLAEGKQERLPELKRIFLEGVYYLPIDLVQKCKEVSIEISGGNLRLY
ncbi:MAG: hypothetical protein Q9169_006284 [Polycauliona sp. 2 TL-2023]